MLFLAQRFWISALSQSLSQHLQSSVPGFHCSAHKDSPTSGSLSLPVRPGQLTLGLPTWMAAAPGAGAHSQFTMREGSRALELPNVLVCIFILEAFPPRTASPITFGSNLKFSTCFSHLASEASSAADFGSWEIPHLCLHLNVFLKRPLLPGTKWPLKPVSLSSRGTQWINASTFKPNTVFKLFNKDWSIFIVLIEFSVLENNSLKRKVDDWLCFFIPDRSNYLARQVNWLSLPRFEWN